ncbi:DUF1574 family protein [Pontibacter ramchanderi]|uniref:Uncharacterized protein DUF1574 n=1 Tax=Pontibacter ramchanderi TaxID=1179743 RepID=A0A2N3U8Z9_9BACT|nr:DUF1574 family protein [Pontibacter ramchanderi]PKV63238.1 uncharacterized protein DUF1574 [Pontibacter ramchanderi]
MKRFVIKIVGVIALSIALYAIVLFLYTLLGFNRWLPNARNTTGRGYYTYSRLQELQTIKNIDILFIGSSHMYRGVDTRVFEKSNISTFNLGTSGQTPYNTYYLLKEHLDRIRPKTIVMDVYLEGMDSDGMGASIEIVSNHELTDNMLEMVNKKLNFETANSLLSIYISRFHTPLSEVIEVKPTNDYYIPGGYIETNKLKNELTEKQLKNLKSHSIAINDLQKTYLNKVVELCNESNVRLILIVPPLTKEFKNNISNYEAFINNLQILLHEKGVLLIDYNNREELILNTFEDFLDANHLNPIGALKFSYLLKNDLSELGINNHIQTK